MCLVKINLNIYLTESIEPPHDPLKRTGHLFGGVMNDVKSRYPLYMSDFIDGFNTQCIAALFFIFFTCLSPCIAFGGLLSKSAKYSILYLLFCKMVRVDLIQIYCVYFRKYSYQYLVYYCRSLRGLFGFHLSELIFNVQNI